MREMAPSSLVVATMASLVVGSEFELWKNKTDRAALLRPGFDALGVLVPFVHVCVSGEQTQPRPLLHALVAANLVVSAYVRMSRNKWRALGGVGLCETPCKH